MFIPFWNVSFVTHAAVQCECWSHVYAARRRWSEANAGNVLSSRWLTHRANCINPADRTLIRTDPVVEWMHASRPLEDARNPDIGGDLIRGAHGQ